MEDKEEEDGEKYVKMYAVRRWRMEGKGLGGGSPGGVVRGDGETRGGEGGWMEGRGREGRKRRWRRRGLDDKRKIQTGQSFLFANRAPDKDSACSGADRAAISLPYSPLLLHPSASLAQQIVCKEERRKGEKKTKKKRRALSVQHHGATINQPQRSN